MTAKQIIAHSNVTEVSGAAKELYEHAVKLEQKNAALIAVLESAKRFENCGLIATSGHSQDGVNPANCTCHVHPELEGALKQVYTAINNYTAIEKGKQ